MLLASNHGSLPMLFRAILAIAVVSVLIPHEPDLGLGRPGAGASLPSPAAPSSANGLSRTKDACGIPACAGALAALSAFGLAPKEGRNLDDVRSEIQAAVKARGERLL